MTNEAINLHFSQEELLKVTARLLKELKPFVVFLHPKPSPRAVTDAGVTAANLSIRVGKMIPDSSHFDEELPLYIKAQKSYPTDGKVRHVDIKRIRAEVRQRFKQNLIAQLRVAETTVVKLRKVLGEILEHERNPSNQKINQT